MSLYLNSNLSAMEPIVTSTRRRTLCRRRCSACRRACGSTSAADDAAGYTISQNLTTQINGVQQAQRNAQDGVSLVQTADGSLAEVEQMLQRIRELAVQYRTAPSTRRTRPRS